MKKFIKFGGAESYQNVDIEFISGKKATLTIFHDGTEKEVVELQGLETEEEMHQLMLQKGFVLKEEEELKAIMEKSYGDLKAEEEKREKARKRKEEILLQRERKVEQKNRSEEREKEIEELTNQIKQLKKEGGGKNRELIAELSKKRIQLTRERIFEKQKEGKTKEEVMAAKKKAAEAAKQSKLPDFLKDKAKKKKAKVPFKGGFDKEAVRKTMEYMKHSKKQAVSGSDEL